jgi:hypothetical protein
MIQALLASLHPDGDRLLAEISKHVTDDMLVEISLADYGEDQEQHLVALRRMRDAGKIVEPIQWCPGEVLELIRNSQPENPVWKPGCTGIRGHWMRAFACAALLRAREEPWNYTADGAFPSENLIRLIDSIAVLQTNFSPELVRLVAWMMLHSDLETGDAQVVYHGVGLLWLALSLKMPMADADLLELAEWIVQREAAIRKRSPQAFDRWLLGIGQDPPPSPWEVLGKKLSVLNMSGHIKELQEWVKLIGEELMGDRPGA